MFNRISKPLRWVLFAVGSLLLVGFPLWYNWGSYLANPLPIWYYLECFLIGALFTLLTFAVLCLLPPIARMQPQKRAPILCFAGVCDLMLFPTVVLFRGLAAVDAMIGVVSMVILPPIIAVWGVVLAAGAWFLISWLRGRKKALAEE